MKSNVLFLVLCGFALQLVACGPEEKKPATEDAAIAKVDSTYAMLTDLRIAQLKLINKSFADDKISAAIKDYENAKNLSDRVKLVDGMQFMPTTAEIQGPPEPHKKTGYDFLTSVTTIPAEKFDLAIKINDAVVQQVKLMNTAFKDLDTGAVNAIAFYEKLSKEDKAKLLTNAAAYTPVPDYIQRYLSQEFRRTYYMQRLQMQQMFNRWLLQRRFINEFPQGFKDLGQFGMQINDKAFDLKIAKK